jgi:hypothetical protein
MSNSDYNYSSLFNVLYFFVTFFFVIRPMMAELVDSFKAGCFTAVTKGYSRLAMLQQF